MPTYQILLPLGVREGSRKIYNRSQKTKIEAAVEVSQRENLSPESTKLLGNTRCSILMGPQNVVVFDRCKPCSRSPQAYGVAEEMVSCNNDKIVSSSFIFLLCTI